MPAIVSRGEWLAARTAFQDEIERAAAAMERVNEARRALPMVEVTKEYVFESPDGPVSLLDLFAGRDQLVIYHFMFAPDWDQGCPFCSFNMDGIGHLAHLNARDTTFAVISRAPISKIEPFRQRMGWDFPWVSSGGNDFNRDFHATLDGTADTTEYMYRDKAFLDAKGGYYFETGDQGGWSVFLREGDRIFHTYSDFDQTLDVMNATVNMLDLTPKGQVEAPVKHHDRY
jgi:predicted dithiol-disulfide oxidoreductase (DUF899 family)